jgi:hypothetical protein
MELVTSNTVLLQVLDSIYTVHTRSSGNENAKDFEGHLHIGHIIREYYRSAMV